MTVEITYTAHIPQEAPIVAPRYQNAPKNTISDLITKTFPEEPEVMLAIAECESNTMQFKDGKVVTSHTSDVGVFQVNLPVWEHKALDLGYDIYSTHGNIKMARYIYEVQGKNAWVCYKHNLLASLH